MKTYYQRIILLTLLISVGLLLRTSAQAVLQKAYGGGASDYFQVLKPLPGNKIVMAGSTSSYGPLLFSTDQNIYVIETTALGDTIWNKVFSYQSNIDEAVDILPVNMDSSLLMLDNFRDSTFANEYFGLSKLDQSGTILWNKKYSAGGHICFATSLAESSQGYLIAGSIYMDATDNYDAFLMKVDTAGNFLWAKTYSTQSPYADKAFSISPVSAGGILLTGVSYYNIIHDYSLLAIRTDSAGNPVWMKTYANSLNSRGVQGYELQDGSFLLGGQAVNFGSGANDFLLIHTDANGDTLWSKVYGDNMIQLASDMVLTGDAVVLLGTTNTMNYPKVLMLKTDIDGNVLTAMAYGDSLYSQSGKKCFVTPDKGLVIGGERIGAFDQGYSAEDFYLIRTDSNYTSGCEESTFIPDATPAAVPVNNFSSSDTITFIAEDIVFNEDQGMRDTAFCATVTAVSTLSPKSFCPLVYPNPSNGYFTFENSESTVSGNACLFNMLGKKVFSMKLDPHSSQLTYKTDLATGMYFLTITMDNGNTCVRKIIIE